ncbi:RacP protein [Streptomyces sp. NPDC001530]|uniref:RacP protein n=1 Tax=Streptomyces sp. NPDC001530 TaxID=3364582 RepID=UPI0036BEDB8F
MTFSQLVKSTELTRSQVQDGLAMLRDQAAEKDWPPVVWSLGEGYRFSGDADVLRKYEIARIHECFVELGRLLTGTVAPHGRLIPQDKWIAYVETQLNAVETTLDLLSAA